MSMVKNAGATSLQCVFDFDATISKAFHNGKKAQSCHGCLESILPVEMKSFFDALNAKFMKIEFDPAMTKEQKTPHMVEWWSTAHSKMTEATITKDQVDQAVKESEVILREREGEFFD